MLDINERLRAQNNGQPWIDCNERSRPRAHRWAFERTGLSGVWYRCTECPVATVVGFDRSRTTEGVLGQPVPPAPFLR